MVSWERSAAALVVCPPSNSNCQTSAASPLYLHPSLGLTAACTCHLGGKNPSVTPVLGFADKVFYSPVFTAVASSRAAATSGRVKGAGQASWLVLPDNRGHQTTASLCFVSAPVAGFSANHSGRNVHCISLLLWAAGNTDGNLILPSFKTHRAAPVVPVSALLPFSLPPASFPTCFHSPTFSCFNAQISQMCSYSAGNSLFNYHCSNYCNFKKKDQGNFSCCHSSVVFFPYMGFSKYIGFYICLYIYLYQGDLFLKFCMPSCCCLVSFCFNLKELPLAILLG